MSIISLEELYSWLKTVAAELITELILGVATGLLSLLESGDLGKSALVALGVAVLTATVRTLLKAIIAKVSSLRKK